MLNLLEWGDPEYFQHLFDVFMNGNEIKDWLPHFSLPEGVSHKFLKKPLGAFAAADARVNGRPMRRAATDSHTPLFGSSKAIAKALKLHMRNGFGARPLSRKRILRVSWRVMRQSLLECSPLLLLQLLTHMVL